MSTRQTTIHDAVEAAYRLFARYPAGAAPSPCTYCYTEEQLARFRSTPLRALDDEAARLLTWEASDHWTDVATYKHYLPRILERLSRSENGDLYPSHFPETLSRLDFAGWPRDERACVEQFLDAYERALPEEDTTAPDWVQARQRLRHQTPEKDSTGP